MHEHRVEVRPPGSAASAPPIDRHGSMVNKKVRAVCGRCNNGWMSEIESKAKEPLTKLMFRHSHLVSYEDQIHLLNWIFLKLCVAEFDKPPSPAFHQATRDLFFKERALPENLYIDLLAYEGGGNWTAAYHRQALWIGNEPDTPESDATGFIQRNTQSVTFGVGWLTICAFHSYAIAAEPSNQPQINRRIWPSTGTTISWPPAQIMTSDELATLARAFDSYVVSRRGGFPALE